VFTIRSVAVLTVGRVVQQGWEPDANKVVNHDVFAVWTQATGENRTEVRCE